MRYSIEPRERRYVKGDVKLLLKLLVKKYLKKQQKHLEI